MGHRCSCQGPVRECSAPRGLVLRSESPVAQERLAACFPGCSSGDGTIIASGCDYLERVREAIEPLSRTDRAAVRAVSLVEGGVIDPWSAAPVEQVLDRLESDWFPGVLNTGALRMVYQPIVDAATLVPFGHEALVRTGDSVNERSAGEIIAAAKAHDALLKFDQTARRLAITSGYPKLAAEEKLFVNFLPLTVYDPEVCLRTTFESAAKVGADLSRLVFEVVESEDFPDIARLRAILDYYRERGAQVGLDDFGAGNTAMVFIDELKPDYIKLDKQLITRAVADNRPELVLGVVRHAKQQGIRVIAEGVETHEHLAFAREAGADFVQGYLIARPSAEPAHRIKRPDSRGGAMAA